ncbi:MAG: winged helix-turn-helix transcriptional regulator, partial [Duncaniella sp.]|nr:winged helix-turn-helix transcriptional regulator [Duncaniella sp.]
TKNRPEIDQEPTRNRPGNEILDLLRNNPYISRAEIARKIGMHPSSVKRRLEGLVNNGSIRRIGPDRGGRWEII